MLIIDRFEGSYAVCECDDGTPIHIARHLIVESAQEGDALDCWEDMFAPNKAQTEKFKGRIRRKMDYLFSRDQDQTT